MIKEKKDVKIKIKRKDFRASSITKNNYENFIQNENMGLNLQEWYKKEFKTDKISDDIPSITFAEALSMFFNDIKKFEEEVCANDSLVRERIFNKFAKLCKVPYDNFYDIWLHQ